MLLPFSVAQKMGGGEEEKVGRVTETKKARVTRDAPPPPPPPDHNPRFTRIPLPSW